MSRTLGRLRRATGDEILVRTGRTMTPTAYAVAVRPDVHVLVERAQSLLAPARELDLTTLERTFTVRCHDAVAAAMAPPLLAAVRGLAPGVRVRLLAEANVDTDELRHGHVDLEISAGGPAPPEVNTETIGLDRLVVAMREDHPLAGGVLVLDDYAQPSTSPSRAAAGCVTSPTTSWKARAASGAWLPPRRRARSRCASSPRPISS